MENNIYLIKNLKESSYKIGVGKHPNTRLKQLQTGNSCPLSIIEIYPTELAYKIEKVLHRRYSHLHEEGEWFNLTIVEEVSFIENCEKIENTIKFLKESGNVFI